MPGSLKAAAACSKAEALADALPAVLADVLAAARADSCEEAGPAPEAASGCFARTGSDFAALRALAAAPP
jgi:hypothetical protein